MIPCSRSLHRLVSHSTLFSALRSLSSGAAGSGNGADDVSKGTTGSDDIAKPAGDGGGRTSGADVSTDGGDWLGDTWSGAHTGGGDSDPWGDVSPSSSSSSWSTGLTAEHFDGASPVGHRVDPTAAPTPMPISGDVTDALAAARQIDEEEAVLDALEADNKKDKAFADSWRSRLTETYQLLNQVREPGIRGAYLKDSEKAEMYKKHKENPEEHTVEKLAKEYRVMRQRVLAILWLKEMEEEEEKKLGEPLDDSVEILLDQFPEFFNSHDREFHVASLPYKPEFKVMPEGWDGTARDPDEVLYEISKKEEDMLYEEFCLNLKFNKMKVAGEVKHHKYSRRRPDKGWDIVVEKLGASGKRGASGGWKYVSTPDGASRPLNEKEKVYLKRETPRRRKKIIAPFSKW